MARSDRCTANPTGEVMRRSLAAVFATVLMALAVAVVGIGPAAADTGGYPYATMACEHSPYATSGTGYWCANYDWGPVHTAAYDDPSEISPYGYAYRNCTDFVAWKLDSLGVPASVYKGLGNANTWGTRAAGHGVTNNSTPAVGSVAVSTAGTSGHVAFVTAVNGANITVAEYNENEDGNYGTRVGTPSALGFSSFDHFEAYESGGGSGSGGPVSIAAGNNNGQMTVQLANFPTGTSYFYCHTGDPSTYPTGGSITGHASLSITSPNQYWASGLCGGAGNSWIGIQATDGNSYYSNQVTLGTAPPSITVGNNAGQMTVQLANFPTGVSYFFCHFGDPSGYPTGGSVPNHGQVTIGSPGQGWSSGLCSGTGNAWIGIQATDGNSYYSNQVVLGTAPYGSVDAADTPAASVVHVAGWAVDGDTPTTPVTIDVYIGDELHVLGAANGYRPDVGATFPGVGDYHGYDGQVTTSKTGDQNVCVYAIDTQGGPNPQLGCRTLTVLTDTTPPSVTSADPADQAVNVDPSSDVHVTFSEDVKGVSGQTLFLNRAGHAPDVAGTVTYDSASRTATLVPVGGLLSDTEYVVNLNLYGGITDLAGNRLPVGGWSFTTGPSPTVLNMTPSVGATNVPVYSNITATFSEPVSYVDNTQFIIEPHGSGSPIAASVSYDSATQVATLNPAVNLAPNTLYSVGFWGGTIKDAAGNPLTPTFWTFTTGAAPTDVTPPTVSSRTPAKNATSVPTSTNITVTFSEPVEVGVEAVTVTDATGAQLSFSWSFVPSLRLMTLDTAGLLSPDTKYTVTVVGGNSGVEDEVGNLLATTSWSFTTGPAPTVTVSSPSSGATAVSRTTVITATFSEPVLGVSGTTVTLKNPAGKKITAAVGYNATTGVVTLTPASRLASRTKYTVTLTGGVSAIRDLVGNPLKTVKWSFTTGS